MFAIVEDDKITSMPKGNKGIKIGDNQYPASIFTLWTESERNAIGVYTVEIDETNKKDEAWYNNTNMTYEFSDGKVTGSYETATARAHADTTYTNTDKSNGVIPADKDVGDVKEEGLKTVLIRQVKEEAKSLLSDTDWYITRNAEKSIAIPSAITTYRDSIRAKQAEMETAITNAADTPALETLYTRNNSGVRPLGDFPVKE